MNINVDQDKCLRCGMCTGIAMDVFEFDDEGNISPKNENITEENKGEVEEAIASCPVGAISNTAEE